MEIKDLHARFSKFLKKYRYAAIILAIGLVLMAIPVSKSETATKEPSTDAVTIPELPLEERIADVLSKIKGAGEVQVILTVAAGEQTIYQTNQDSTTDNDSNKTSVDTVTVTDSDRDQNGLVCQVIPPVYQGAVVVCQGADNSTVRLAVVDAVSKLTGLGANRISVLKMK